MGLRLYIDLKFLIVTHIYLSLKDFLQGGIEKASFGASVSGIFKYSGGSFPTSPKFDSVKLKV